MPHELTDADVARRRREQFERMAATLVVAGRLERVRSRLSRGAPYQRADPSLPRTHRIMRSGGESAHADTAPTSRPSPSRAVGPPRPPHPTRDEGPVASGSA